MGRSLGRPREGYPNILKCHARSIRRGKERVEVPDGVLGHGAYLPRLEHRKALSAKGLSTCAATIPRS